ncbi:MAG: replicative DNA helicase [Spirochaetia bacterium]
MNDILKDKIPPHNEEAEKATLGALFLDPDAINTVINYLRPDDFYRTAHKVIFEAILDLSNRNKGIDLITVIETLKAEGNLEPAGGAAYVSGLTSAVPTAANVEYYAELVQGQSIRRNLIKIAREIVAFAHDGTQNSRAIIEEAEKRIFEITDKQQVGKYQSVGEIISETIDAIEKIYNTKETYTGVPTGFADLDALTSGFQKSELIIIGARPSIGKTAFALSVAANIAIKYKIPVGFFTLEMANQQIMMRLLSAEARINARKLREGMLKPSDFHSITEAAGRIYDAPMWIEDTPGMRLLDLRAQARRMKSKHDIKIIFIDYITLITAENKEIPRHEQIAEISRSLKALARELEIPVVVLSQVKRETEGKRPTLSDIRESGSIEQDADVVMFLHRERTNENQQEDTTRTELIIAKQRNGPIDTVEIAFLKQYTKFEPYSHESR